MNRKITIVVAVSENGVIGKNNELIWHLPEDLKRFKKITSNNVVVMGRKTHESIGKSLPNRLNVILSRNSKWNSPLGDNCVVCYSVEEVLERFKYRDLYIIGGGEIYKKFLPYSDIIEMTLIHKHFDGDTYFTDIGKEWIKVSSEKQMGSDFDYEFQRFEKKY